MCRLLESTIANCLLCQITAHRKCPHEIAVCTNPAVHPRWKSYYYKNAGDISTFQGCGFCRYAAKAGLKTPATQLTDNPGWSGCCYPPAPKYYSWIPPEDWPLVAAYHHMEIPDHIKAALNNFNASTGNRTRARGGGIAAEKPLSIETTRSIQQPVPIPHKGSAGPYHPRSYSPSAIYLPSSDRSPPRSISSKDSNSSGSPPSSTGSRRRDYDFEGSERSSNSPSSPTRSSSQDGHGHPIAGRPSSSLQNRRGESPIDRVLRDKEPVGAGGKRRSNSDPKNQTPPSAYGYDRAYDRGRDKERDASPNQGRLKPSPPASVVSSNHPYANPYSPASSSMSKLGSSKTSSTPTYRTPVPPPRARETGGPSITSVMANMSLNSGLSYNTPAASMAAARARMPPAEPLKRGVIPPHVRRAGSVVSGTSSSSSSTNSSAQEGTVISDGAFTDYLSDDSDFELQRLAEVEAEIAYQEAMMKHEEMEFKAARDSLSTRRMPAMSAPRIRA